MKIKMMLFGALLLLCPLTVNAEESEENEIVSVLFEGDVANGVTDNISFVIETADAAEGDILPVNLMRINKFQARETMSTGKYIITDIDTHNPKYTVDDIPLTIEPSDLGKSKVVTIRVGDGAKGEKINTSFNSDKGVTPAPTKNVSTSAVISKTDAVDINKIQEVPHSNQYDWIKKVISYVALFGIGGLCIWGYKKLKDMWNN